MKAFQHSISHHFIIEKMTFSFFESFLFIKEMNMNELIQFVKSFISILININNFKNELTSHTSQSLTSLSFLSTYILQKDAS